MRRKIIIVSGTVLLVLVFFVNQYIGSVHDQINSRKGMLNFVYHNLRNTSYILDELIPNIENEETDYEANEATLMALSFYFVKLDTALSQYRMHYPSERLAYGSIPNFDYIASTLTSGSGVANNLYYSGIPRDNAISENELLYLTYLRDDILIMVESLISPDNPPQENDKLTIRQLNSILDTFFSKWSFHSDNSPYELLRTEE